MPDKREKPWHLDRGDITWFWQGGRNVTIRITHEPTGVFIERSTHIDEERFTKKRLRTASELLQSQLFAELERRIAKFRRRSQRSMKET